MAKRDDDLADQINQRLVAEGKRIETEPLPGVRVGINLPEPTGRRPYPPGTPPADRLHGIPVKVTAADLAVIKRSIVHQLAVIADLDEDSNESAGRALASICRLYLLSEQKLRQGAP